MTGVSKYSIYAVYRHITVWHHVTCGTVYMIILLLFLICIAYYNISRKGGGTLDKSQKVITIDEVDERIKKEHIRDVLATAIAKSLARTVIKEVCGEDTDT